MASPELFRKWRELLFKKPEAGKVPRTITSISKAGDHVPASPESQPQNMGGIQMRAEVADPNIKFKTIEKSVSAAISEKVAQQGAQTIPNRRFEIVIEEAARHGEINAQIRNEVRRIGQLLTETPSPEQWDQIQKSLNTLSSYNSADVIDVAKYVRKEVSTYAFSRVVQSADQYGLTAADAEVVADTFRHVSISRYRSEFKQPGAPEMTVLQSAIEQSVLDAEVAREWNAVTKMAKEATDRKEADELGESSEQLRQLEEIKLADAKDRIQKLMDGFPREDQEWLQSLVDKVNVSDDAAAFLLSVAEGGPDALSNPAYLFAKGIQWRVASFDDMLINPAEIRTHEARMIQTELVSRILDKKAHPSSVNTHNIDFSKVDISVINRNLRFDGTMGGVSYAARDAEWWAKEAGTHRVGFYDEADATMRVGGIVTNTKIKEFLVRAQEAFDGNPKGAQDFDLVQQLDSQFQRILEDVGKSSPTEITEDVLLYKAALSRNLRDLIEKGRDHVSLGLSSELKKEMWPDPSKRLHEQIRLVEKFSRSYEGDTPAAETAMDVLRQMQRYLFDPQFGEEWRRWMLEQPGHPSIDLINAKVDMFVEVERAKLSTDIALRRMLVQNYNALFSVGVRPEKMSQLLSPFGSEGALTLLGHSDGKVQSVFDYFDAAVMSAHRDKHSNDHKWLSLDELKDIYADAIEDLKAGMCADVAGMSVPEIEELGFLAQEVSFIFGRPVLAMTKGLSPIESGFYGPGTRPEKIHPFSGGGGSNIESAVKARKYIRFGSERWMINNDGTISNIDGSAQFAAKGNKVNVVVDELVSRAQSRGKLEDLVRQTCDISAADLADPNSASIIEGKIARTYLKFDLDGVKREAPKTLAEAAADVPLLKERMMSKLGVLIVENSTMSYTFLDSGPVTYQVQTKLAEMFTYSDQLAISMKMRDAYGSLISAKNHHAKDHAIEHLEKVLEKASEYNPVDLLNGHVDTQNMLTEDWFATLNKADLQKFLSPKDVANGGIVSTADLVKVMSRQASSLESLIKRKVRQGTHLQRVNWHHAISDGHMEEIRTMLRAYTGKKTGSDIDIGLKQYIETMKSIATHVGSEPMIKDATKVDFSIRYGYQTQNSYDCWLDIAETGRFGDKVAESKPLSHRLGRRSSGDMLIRTYGDQETALKGIDIIMQAYKTQDWKMYLKAVAEIQSTIRNVYGDPWDGRSVMYITAGLLEGLSKDQLSEWTFGLTAAFDPKDSKMRRVLNSEHAGSLEIEDRYEYLGELENVLMESLHEVDHELAEVFMEYVGMNFGPGLHIVENDILWAKRIYRVQAFAAVIFLLAAIKEGSEGYTESTSGGGGGGGGGGAPAHH